MVENPCDFYNWLLKVLPKIPMEDWVKVKRVVMNNYIEKPHGKWNYPFNVLSGSTVHCQQKLNVFFCAYRQLSLTLTSL